jgi:ProP effector
MTDTTETTHQATHPTAGQPDQPLAASEPRQNKPQQAHQRRLPSPALEKLFELYPKLFGAHFLPLKLGVFQDLLARHPNDFDKAELKLAMGQHARSTRYLECVAAGLPRHDLDGNVVEPVSPEHVHHAIVEVFKRRQARHRDDLTPKLQLRLMQAIETSGLSLDDYAERMRVADEEVNAVLDAALSELKLEAARREALIKAFQASGKTEAEFADMYGVDPRQLRAVLSALEPAAH